MALRTKVIMEDYTTIEENVFQYLQTKNDCVDPKAKYTLSITKISVMTNFNYLVTIQNKITQQTEEQVLYRKFGEISECVGIIPSLAIHLRDADKKQGSSINKETNLPPITHLESFLHFYEII